jgi:hypothetical protein
VFLWTFWSVVLVGPGSVRRVRRCSGVEIRVTVECYAGYRGEETPRAFTIGERRIEVSEVLDAWLAPDHRYFKLKDADGHTYVLRHDVAADEWELTLFER